MEMPPQSPSGPGVSDAGPRHADLAKAADYLMQNEVITKAPVPFRNAPPAHGSVGEEMVIPDRFDE